MSGSDKIPIICYEKNCVLFFGGFIRYNKIYRGFLYQAEGGCMQEKLKKYPTDYIHLEDMAMKTAAQYFGEELLGYLGVKENQSE